MQTHHPIIGIVCGTKATDALLCESLEAAGFELRIVHVKIPPQLWIPWIWKRIKERGFHVFLGHLALAGWLRIERYIERLYGTSLWKKEVGKTPTWKNVRAPRVISFSERTMISLFKNVDQILMLDAFRYSHRFFRALAIPCLQIVWGDIPDYLGDSGGYWAYVHQDPVAVTVIHRQAQFHQITIEKRILVATGPNEDLRTIKIKQAVAIARELPKILLTQNPLLRVQESTQVHSCRMFYAPTLWTYLRQSRGVDFPSYAFRLQNYTITSSLL